MKRWIAVAIAVSVLAVTMVGTALAAPPNPTTGLGPGAGMHMGLGVGRGMGAPAWAGQPEEVLDLLDMTAEDLHAARLAGKSLAGIADDQGISKEDLVSTILGAKQADLDQLVADGTLTQEQADAMYARMETQVPVMVDRTATGPALGRGQNRGAAGGFTGCGGRGMGPGWQNR